MNAEKTPGAGLCVGETVERFEEELNSLHLKKQEVPVPPLPAPRLFIAHIGHEAGNEATKLAASLRRAAISAIAQIKPKINDMSGVPATENMPSGGALKQGDTQTAMGGKTIEVVSTDAEGRLVLADAIGYVKKLGARQMVDVATLTGAVRIALGNVCTGVFGNNQLLINRVIAAGAEAGELIWQMPMYDQYKEQNKSEVADIKNTGGRYGGAITAAQFLAEFAGDIPWAHLDIAGTNMSDKERNYTVKGATGVMVRTLINFVLSLAQSSKK